ncbi:MAG: hypothetical protein VB016_00855 [Methanomassiliicoccaceae archaeon]|nr:hypothetical protein [Methanomassiliicoccaceae archaeon]
MDGDVSSRELWLDTEGMLSAGYLGEFEIAFMFCGTVCIGPS